MENTLSLGKWVGSGHEKWTINNAWTGTSQRTDNEQTALFTTPPILPELDKIGNSVHLVKLFQFAMC